MKKLISLGLFVVVLLCGCKKIESDLDNGRIHVTDTRVNVTPAIRELIADRSWEHVSSSSRHRSEKTVRTGITLSTKEGLTLPSSRHTVESSTTMVAKTEAGHEVAFTIHKAKPDETVVTITTDQTSEMSLRSITADLVGRLDGELHRKRVRKPMIFQIEPFSPLPTDANRLTAQWTAKGDWTRSARHIQFDMHMDKNSRHRFSMHLDQNVSWQTDVDTDDENAIRFDFAKDSGVMTFEGTRSRVRGAGRVLFTPDKQYLSELSQLISDELEQQDLLNLFFWELDLETAQAMAAVFPEPLPLKTLRKLLNYHVSPEFVAGLKEAGYDLSIEHIIKLKTYHVSLDMLQSFKRAGFDYTAEEMIKIKNYHLPLEQFVGFHEAGYTFTMDEHIKAKNYHIPITMAKTLHRAGFRYSLDELIKLKRYHIKPPYILTFKQGGYEWSIDQLIKAQRYHIKDQEAIRLKQAGYDFSLEDLIDLNRYHVSTDFIIEVMHPDYEPFTAKELIDFRNKRMTAQTINKIRKSRKHSTD